GPFFFQAEDGIRGLIVTGVQTCALPICYCSRRRKSVDQVELEERRELAQRLVGILHLDRGHPQLARRLEVAADVVEERDARRRRSEERRVGREGRGWPASD